MTSWIVHFIDQFVPYTDNIENSTYRDIAKLALPIIGMCFFAYLVSLPVTLIGTIMNALVKMSTAQ